MRKLYLLRHAKSSWEDPAADDFHRPLNGRGRKSAAQIAEYLAAHKIRPAMALVSAALRTRATYQLIEPRLEGVPVSFEEDLYAAGKSQLLQRLHKLDGHLASVMVVGHNPGLERLAASLAGHNGDPEALAHLKEKFPTGALAVLETDARHWAELGPGTCRLTAFIRPKDLMGGEDGE